MANLISVLIPCRDSAAHVGALIDALQSQEVPSGWDVEVIAGYQESRDNTLAVLTEKNVQVAFCKEFGPAVARNAAAKAARGTLLWFIDSDARPTDRQFLVRTVRKAEALGEFGGLGGPILLDPAQKWNPIAVADHFACWFNWTARRRSEKTTLFQPTTSFIVPRAVFDRAGGFDPSFRILQDFEFQERIQALGLPLYFDDTLSVFHRARDTMRSSLKHNWWWGVPFREAYLKRKQAQQWMFLHHGRLFSLNLPLIYIRRLRIVLSRSLKVSLWQTLYCFPFLLMTIFAWAMGVSFGKGQPPAETDTACRSEDRRHAL